MPEDRHTLTPRPSNNGHDGPVLVNQSNPLAGGQDFYQALYTQSQAQFDTYVDSGTILNNYAHIFDVSFYRTLIN